MYSSPSSSRSPRVPLKRQVSEGPIGDFAKVIEDTAASNWQKRASSFQKLIESIPEDAFEQESGSKWYYTPGVLRHLAIPIGELLKDPRSTVVKRTCVGLSSLFQRCKSDARYLFKDMMPTVLSVHAQTVQVIRQAVENMVLESIPEVPCKMVMPLWMERLRIDRSRTVRDACALYLGHSLQHWNEEGYLTDEIWFQVGRTLLGSVRDPSPNVRTYSKQVLEKIQRSHPGVFDQLLNDEEGPAGKDIKLHRWLKSLGQSTSAADAAEDLSVASRFSYNSDMRMRSKTATAAFSPPQKAPTRRDEEGSPIIPNSIDVQSSSRGITGRRIASSNGSIGSSSRRSNGGRVTPDSSRGAPPRVPPKKIQTKAGSRDPEASPRYYKSSALDKNEDLTDDEDEEEITKQHSAETVESTPSFPSDLNITSWRETIKKSVEQSKTDSRYQQYLASNRSPVERKPQGTAVPATPETPAGFQPTASTVSALASSDENRNEPEDDNDGEGEEEQDESEEAFITNAEALKQYSKRRTRGSLLIQERLRMSSSMEDDEYAQSPSGVIQKRSDEENNIPNPTTAPPSNTKPPVFPGVKGAPASSSTSSQQAPAHMVIAIRLLRAHKEHVDKIMETLRIEMDTLRDFDQLLEEAGRPTEEEVLDYFESVGYCLERRSADGAKLQEELDRISQGEPPMK